tara:strand:+ start:4226 stop:4720 length:495 start_codon:yes stop_codon:yes gene_type:complete
MAKGVAMSQSDKIYSSKVSLTINILTVIFVPLIWWHFFDFTFPEMTQDAARNFSQIGALINLLAAMFLAIRFLWKGRYSRRQLQIEKLDTELEKHFEFLKHQTFTEEQKSKYEEIKFLTQEDHLQEMKNILELDKVEHNHMYLGLTCLFIGTVMQILGAGYVSP